MFVVIDSNIIIGNYNLRAPDFAIFSKHFPEKNIDVYLSKVSVEEIYKNHKKHITKFAKDYNAALKPLNNASLTNLPVLSKDYAKKEHEKFKDYFSKSLKSSNIRILDYPKISHEEVVKYSVLGKKPFNERVFEEVGKKSRTIDTKDTGYKDFLIWSSIVEFLQKSKRPIVFITKDTDFAKENKLHPDLVEHLVRLGLNANQIEICNSFSDFNERYLKDVYKLVELKTLLNTTDLRSKLEDNAKNDLEIQLQDYSLPGTIGLRTIFEDPTISGVSDFYKFETIKVEVLNDDEFLVAFEAYVDCNVQFFVYKSDLYTIPDDEDPSIVDSDWNEHYVLAEDVFRFRVVCSFISDRDASIRDLSIDLIELDK
jgi:hypothetical protein